MSLSPSLRRFLLATTAFVLSLSVIWWALWSLAAAQYRGVIDGWIDSGRAAGYDITYADRSLHGFPLRVVASMTNLHWKNTEGIEFQADQIDIGATPWRWQNYDARFKGHVELKAPLDADGRALVLAGEYGRARVELDADGYWKQSHIMMSDATIGRSPDYLFLAKQLDASAQRPHVAPANYHEVGFTLSGEAQKVTLPAAMPSPFGPVMSDIAADIRVMGDVPDFRKKESVALWNSGSGVVEFDRLRMDWGSLLMTARGTMGFDDDLQPEGAFSSAIDHHEDVMKALMEHGYIARRQEGMLTSALTLFAKPSKFNGSSGVEVPVTIQLGGLFLGPVKIFSFSEIVWPGAATTSHAVTSPLAPADTSDDTEMEAPVIGPQAPAAAAKPLAAPAVLPQDAPPAPPKADVPN